MRRIVKLPPTDPYDIEDKEKELLMEAGLSQASMEGLFRHLFQACQQQSLTNHVHHYGKMLDAAVGHFNAIQETMIEYEDIRMKRLRDETANNESLM